MQPFLCCGAGAGRLDNAVALGTGCVVGFIVGLAVEGCGVGISVGLAVVG